MPVPRSEAVIDLAAVRANVSLLAAKAEGAELMAVVKADAYGHGMLPVARASLEAGATWLGVAVLEEALALRAGGITGVPVLAWLSVPGEDLAAGIAAEVDLAASAPWMLDELVAAASRAGRPARVHLKIDTGLSRAGAPLADWPDLVTAALRAQAGGHVEVAGVWSHFAYADAPGHPTIARQLEVFDAAVAQAERAGLRPGLRHIANSAATLTLPRARYDLVRPGLAIYGLSPVPRESSYGLVPAMTLRGAVALVKRVPAGQGVSYGHTHVTPRETTLALVPLGYGDGVPRNASSLAEVSLGGRRHRIAGRVCMDQFVLDIGDQRAAAGDEVVLFGPGFSGEPTAQEWADTLGTISYEIVTRIAPRVPRNYADG